MKKSLLILMMVVLAIACVLTSCNKTEDATVESISVDTSSIKTEYNVNELVDLSDIKVTVKYSDGSTETIGADKLTIGEADTSTAGQKKIQVTYEGISDYVDITVVEVDTNNAVIEGVSLPASVTASLAAKENFRDKTEKYYVVGDDNPYVLSLILNVYDKVTNQPITTYTAYTGVSKVYLVEGETETLLEGSAIATYVAIDEENHSYDFTDAAVGKVFKIETRPSKDYENVSKVTKSLTVQVVDGYNIYNAKELNIITNDADAEFGDDDLKQLDIVNSFLAANGITRPDKLAGVVIHGNISITAQDIPAEYLIPATAGTAAGRLYDGLMVYRHAVTADIGEFNIYGNYFTIDSKDIPRVPAKDDAYNGDGISNSALFMFTVDASISDNANYQSYNPADYKTNIYDLALRDNEPTSNNGSEEFLQASKLGLLGIKTRFHTVNLNNIRVEAFMLSLLTDYDHQVVNINKSIFYNAWQNHIFASAKNLLWERNDAEDVDPSEVYYQPTINIVDSSITKCGGPIIISQTADLDEASNKKSANIINIDDKTEINTYISTADAWFAAYPTAAQYAEMIVAANDVIALMSQGTAGFVDATMYEGSDIMNIVMIDMMAGTDLALNPATDLNSILTMNGQYLMNQQDIPAMAAAIIANTNGQLPVFVTSAGGVFGINPQATTPDEAIVTVAGVTPECLAGDYITLYWMGMAITFEYFHFTPAA